MVKNSCLVYFSIKGEFVVEEISQILGLNPTNSHNKGDLNKVKKPYEFAVWEYGTNNGYDVIVANQMRQTIKDLVPLKDKLCYIKNNYDVTMYLQVVPHVVAGQTAPALAPSQDIVEFLYQTGTELDIDLYVES